LQCLGAVTGYELIGDVALILADNLRLRAGAEPDVAKRRSFWQRSAGYPPARN
jgi:hypothetical protein